MGWASVPTSGLIGPGKPEYGRDCVFVLRISTDDDR
jgi:hypothetical protein